METGAPRPGVSSDITVRLGSPILSSSRFKADAGRQPSGSPSVTRTRAPCRSYRRSTSAPPSSAGRGPPGPRQGRGRRAGGDPTARPPCVDEDLPALCVHLEYPLRLRERLRSTNLLERSLEEVQRRTKVIGRFPGETSCLSPVLDGAGPVQSPALPGSASPCWSTVSRRRCAPPRCRSADRI